MGAGAAGWELSRVSRPAHPGYELTNAATSPSSRFLVGDRSSHSLAGHTRTTSTADGWRVAGKTQGKVA